MPTEKQKRPKIRRKQKPVIQLTYKGLCGWLALYFFAAVWIFFLGIMVGRGTAPVSFDIDKLEKELDVLRQTVFEKQQEEMKRDSQFLADQSDFEFYDALKKSKDEINFTIEKHPKTRQSDTHPPSSASGEHVKTSLKSKTKVTASKSQYAVKASPKAKPSKGKGKYTIQVAATKNIKAADRLVVQLQQKGFAAYKMTSRDSQKNPFYRIRVGNFDQTAKARAVLNQLKQIKKDAILITQ